MSRTLVLVYAVVAYLAFFATFLYFMGWVNGLVVPVDINTFVVDNKPWHIADSKGEAILIDVFLLSLFAIQHTIMARDSFKEKFNKIFPEGAERPTFVLLSTIILAVIMWQWRPIPAAWYEPLWNIEGGAGHVLTAISFLGFGIVLASSFMINHFHLFGLMQGYYYYKNEPVPDMTFGTPMFYRYVRHPLMFGLILAFWSTPLMTLGHLVFATTFTAYIFFGLRFEERTLVKHLGEEYREYQKTTSMIIPMPPKG